MNLKVKSGMIVVIVFMDEGKTIFKGVRENKMTKEHYLQMKKRASNLVYRQYHYWLDCILREGYFSDHCSKSRHSPFLLDVPWEH
ncbi:MAG: hypothetical protein ACLT8H_00195 [Streptococcus parasanguinis]